MKDTNIDIPLLSKICKLPGAPGFEQPIRSFLMTQLNDLVDELRTDAMGNIIAIKKGKDSTKKLMLAAHMDEISFIVTHIDDQGFLRIQPMGGFDPKTLTAQRVIIHGKEDIIGVMGTKPIHIMKPEERKKMPDVTDFYVDTGLDVKEVKDKIFIGAPITRERELIEMGDCINSKSLDNRISVYIQLETLRELSNQTPAFDTYAVFTVQEEVGLRGAQAAASGINPDFAIALDVTLANDLPEIQAHNYITSLGKGAAIKVLDGRTICDYRMVDFMKSCAQSNDIPYQMEILPAGGTDTASLQRDANGGSIAGAISIPCRYLHQVIEMTHKKDVRATIELLKSCLLKMDSYDWSFR